jgi:hypothetical protein
LIPACRAKTAVELDGRQQDAAGIESGFNCVNPAETAKEQHAPHDQRGADGYLPCDH